MRTIPYMCLTCSEIVDVAIPIGETGPGECPKCSGELTCDFDMPVNEYVRIEVQTPERLRLCFPYIIGAMGLFQKIAWFQLSLVPLIVTYPLVLSYQKNPSIFRLAQCVGLILILVIFSAWLLFLGVLMLRGQTTIVVDRKRLKLTTSLWGYCQSQTTQINSNYTVYLSRSFCIAQETSNNSRNQMKLWGRAKRYRFLSIKRGTDTDSARYVTHLIRRQLITMGHELQDG